MNMLTDVKRVTVAFKIADLTIIGQVEESDYAGLEKPGFVKVYDPAEIHVNFDPRGGGINYAMLPHQMFKEADYTTINKSHIMTYTVPNEDMVKAYGKNILGHQIEVPPKKLLLS